MIIKEVIDGLESIESKIKEYKEALKKIKGEITYNKND